MSSAESSRDFYMKSVRSLLSIKRRDHHELRLECLEICAKYFYRIADRHMVLQVLAEFDRLAKSYGDKNWIRKTHSYFGIAYADIGDLLQSITSYGKALDLARDIGNKFGESIVLLNMGTALMTAGLYSDSMRAYELAYEMGISEPSLAGNACCSATNMAQISFRQGRYEVGIQHVANALRLDAEIPREQYDLHRVVLEEIYVQLAIGVRNAPLAKERLQICEDYALRAQSKRASLVAQLARGVYEAEYGDATLAASMLKSAARYAQPMTGEWVDAQLFIISALEKAGDVEGALECAASLAAELSRQIELTIQGLTQRSEIAGLSLRADGLDSLALYRSRLEVKVARQHAAHARWEAIERMAMVSELRRDGTGAHGHRVGTLSGAFARFLKLKHEAVKQLEVAGRLHDIGKAAMPDKLLCNPSSLSPAEREVLKAHTKIGGDLLAHSEMAELQCAEVVARHHHERWGGDGYPQGIAGKRIPVACRIVALTDAFDALTHGRPQVPAVSTSVALLEIQLQSGRRFDPSMCDAFMRFIHEIESEHPSIDAYLERDMKASPFSKTIRELDNALATASRRSNAEALAPARQH